MDLNQTPGAMRTTIGIFGRRNAGKSSIINAITGQNLAIVSDVAGTTTDPVKKSMELLPIGPVTIIDTPGLDDEGELGELRIKKALEALRTCHMAVLVVDGTVGMTEAEDEIIKAFNAREIPYLICINKCDVTDGIEVSGIDTDKPVLMVSAKSKAGIFELKEALGKIAPSGSEKRLVGDLVSSGDTAVLVIPIDESAPKGRLILPQQQVIRDLLESGAIPVVARDTELAEALSKLKEKPRMVITDSQAFKTVAKIVPEDIYLTSFSILMARYKGDLQWQVSGAKALDSLENGAKILISEGCTHHRQCNDIGTVKMPGWIRNYTGKDFDFEFTSGGEFPEDLSAYGLVVHCGGCTLNEKEMRYRIDSAQKQNIPITNYGVLISYMNGILERSLRIFAGEED